MTHPVSKEIIQVVGAAIMEEGPILCLQRSASMTLPHLWEFPGRKIEPDETPTQALAREIQEELTLEISVEAPVTSASYDYDFGRVHLTVYRAQILSGQLRLLEHQAARWLAPKTFSV